MKHDAVGSWMRGWLAAVFLPIAACGLADDARELGEIVFRDGGEIPRESLGVQNEFVTNPKGGAPAQAADIRNTLGIRHIRTTFFFDEGFLPTEASQPNFARFDAIVNAIPSDTDLLPILAYAPGWLANRPDWKTVFIARYVIPVLDRYGGDARIAGWEIWNEPDGFCNGRGGAPPGVLNCTADDYVDLVRRVAPEIRARSGAPIVGAATTAINQSFPRHLEFNERMVSLGITDLIDVYNFHWYGEQFEKFALGVGDLLNGTGLPVWCTESGEQGVTDQLDYAEDAFPLFEDQVDRLERIFIYTYFDGAPPESTFGLVAGNGIESDLYQFLRGD